MQLLKYRVWNKYRIIFIVLSLLGMFLYFGFSSSFFQIAIRYLKTGNATGLSSISVMSNYMNLIGYSASIMPVLLFSTVILFYQEKKGLFEFRFNRGESQKKIILSTIMSHAAINAVLYYLIYVIYLTIGYLFIGPVMSYIPRNTFDGIFGEGFSSQYPYLYYLLEGVPSFFIATFIYSVMVCCVALFCKKVYQSIIYMLFYFWGACILLETLRNLFMGSYVASIVSKFEPTYIYGYQGYVYRNVSIGLVFQIMSSLLVPIVLSVILIVITLSRKEKLYE